MSRNVAHGPTRIGPQIDLETAIDGLLGIGLGYAEWEEQLVNRGCIWSRNVRNKIIDKEFNLFKPEIERLLLEENIAPQGTTKSNSRASILKRLKGEVWVEGIPDEREKRIRTRTLFGKDAKPRCLQDKLQDKAKKVIRKASPAVDGAIHAGNNEYTSTKSESPNLGAYPNPTNQMTTVSGQTLHDPAATNWSHINNTSNTSGSSTPYPFTNNNFYKTTSNQDINGPLSTLYSGWSASLDPRMLTDHDHPFQSQPDVTLLSSSEGIRRVSDSAHSYSAVHSSPGLPDQYNNRGANPGPEADMNSFFDYPAYDVSQNFLAEPDIKDETATYSDVAHQNIPRDDGVYTACPEWAAVNLDGGSVVLSSGNTNFEGRQYHRKHTYSDLSGSNQVNSQPSINAGCSQQSTLYGLLPSSTRILPLGMKHTNLIEEPCQHNNYHGSDTEMHDDSSSTDTEMGETRQGGQQIPCPLNELVSHHLPIRRATPQSRSSEERRWRNRTVINLKEALKARETELQKLREEKQAAEARILELEKVKEEKKSAEAKILELEDTIKSLRVSIKRTSREIVLEDNIVSQSYLQKFDDQNSPDSKNIRPQAADQTSTDDTPFIYTNDQKENNSSRYRLPRRIFPPGPIAAVHRLGGSAASVDGSTESSEITTASISSNVSVRELKGRVADLERKMKKMARKMNKKQDSDKKHDSGYASLRLGDSPRSSMAESE